MTQKNERLAKSRLGRLLINRGYISEDQLDSALKIQASQNMLLGEVLISQGLISEKDLKRTLKHQSRYRYTAAFIALASAPFQPMLAMAASPMSLPLSSQKVELSSADMGKFSGMKMLDDEEMSQVSAQGFGMPAIGANNALAFGKNGGGALAGEQHKYRKDKKVKQQDDEQIAYGLADAALTVAGIGPISNFIDAKVTIEGLKYKSGRAPLELLADGRMKFYMPTDIAKISMEDIRIKGNVSGPTLGSIYMSNIHYNSGSSYTVGPKQTLGSR